MLPKETRILSFAEWGARATTSHTKQNGFADPQAVGSACKTSRASAWPDQAVTTARPWQQSSSLPPSVSFRQVLVSETKPPAGFLLIISAEFPLIEKKRLIFQVRVHSWFPAFYTTHTSVLGAVVPVTKDCHKMEILLVKVLSLQLHWPHLWSQSVITLQALPPAHQLRGLVFW